MTFFIFYIQIHISAWMLFPSLLLNQDCSYRKIILRMVATLMTKYVFAFKN